MAVNDFYSFSASSNILATNKFWPGVVAQSVEHWLAHIVQEPGSGPQHSGYNT